MNIKTILLVLIGICSFTWLITLIGLVIPDLISIVNNIESTSAGIFQRIGLWSIIVLWAIIIFGNISLAVKFKVNWSSGWKKFIVFIFLIYTVYSFIFLKSFLDIYLLSNPIDIFKILPEDPDLFFPRFFVILPLITIMGVVMSAGCAEFLYIMPIDELTK